MADPTALVDHIVREPGQWVERAGLLGTLVAAVIVLGVALFLLFRWFLKQVAAAEARCAETNKALTAEIVGVREKYEAALLGLVLDAKQTMGKVVEGIDHLRADLREGSDRYERRRGGG